MISNFKAEDGAAWSSYGDSRCSRFVEFLHENGIINKYWLNIIIGQTTFIKSAFETV